MKPSAVKLIPRGLNKLLIPKGKSIAETKRTQHFYQSGWIPRISSRLCLSQVGQLGCLEI